MRQWRENLVGRVFGRLTVVSEGETTSHRRWICQCACGNTKTVLHTALKSESTKSCGCLRSEIVRSSMTVHGQSGKDSMTRIYRIWGGMKARCEIHSATGFDRYGGVGIKVCERWQKFENFVDDMGIPPEGASIDRIDSAKGYEPANCRWATRQEQNENRKSVRVLTHNGLSMNVTQWAKYLGISKATLLESLGKHPIEHALRDRSKKAVTA